MKTVFFFHCREKDLQQTEIENLNSQITTLTNKCDELTLARSDLTKDLDSLRLDFTDQIREYARRVDDTVSEKHSLEQALSHLREEVSSYSVMYFRDALSFRERKTILFPF